ncbi:MAG: twin-arginine translocase TatA/TatE family subunit [Actinobacteria bacterium]|nr:twin-arginine translocase TatA/TatE family subunit [Actinomycetota bacterium]
MPFLGGLNPVHLLIILAIVLLIFGPSKLPQLGKSIGDTIKEFKKASSNEPEKIEGKEKTES